MFWNPSFPQRVVAALLIIAHTVLWQMGIDNIPREFLYIIALAIVMFPSYAPLRKIEKDPATR